MQLALINPNLVLQRSDLFTTGVVYMPVLLASFAASARSAGHSVHVIDAFGEDPNQFRKDRDFLIRGLTENEVAQRIPAGSQVAIFYAVNLTYHRALVKIITAVRSVRPDLRLVVMENSQAVTAYSLRQVQEDFYALGVEFVLTGDLEERGLALLQELENPTPNWKAPDGIGYQANGRTVYTAPKNNISDLDALPFPAWDLFPISNYWKLGYAHGPLSSSKYLPILSSRGCPYPCRFCVIPETNNVKWRGRSAKNVVDEIEYLQKRFSVNEFHFEDVDPTVKDSRIQEMCREIINRKLQVTWKLVSGTKVETIKSRDTVELMAKAGCKYVSISPESGSSRVLKLMNKPFDLNHAIQAVHWMKENGIRTQACFVLGFPGEEEADLKMTETLLHTLVKNGVDEIAQFIITPAPGSAVFKDHSEKLGGFTDYSQLNFSPTWRADYALLNRFRLRLYLKFLMWKIFYHPLSFAKQPINFLRRHFETKMEMVPYRALHSLYQARSAKGVA